MSARNIQRRWQLWQAARAERLQRHAHDAEVQQLRGFATGSARNDPFAAQPAAALPPRPPATKPWSPRESQALMDSLLDGDADDSGMLTKGAAALPPRRKANPLSVMPRSSSDDDGGNFAPRGWRQVKTPRKHRASARMAAGRRSRVHLKKRAWSDDEADSDSL
jgi:hypothetical protein